MRTVLSDYFVARAERDPNYVILSGDHGYTLFDSIRKASPTTFVNVGIAEQNMIGLAAGLALEGLRPMVYGLCSFVPVRVLEQIKLDLCHGDLPVTMLGDGAGLVYSKLGVSHQSLEDIASLRSLPNISIYSPADKYELAACLKHAEEAKKPAYIRIGKADLPPVHQKSLEFAKLAGGLLPVGQAGTGDSGRRVAFVATGSMVSTALAVAAGIQGFSCDVFSVPLLKPLDDERVAALLKKYPLIFTMEEHCVAGGLGSIVAEIVTDRGFGSRVVRIGSPFKFSETIGTYAFVRSTHGLDEETVRAKVQRELK